MEVAARDTKGCTALHWAGFGGHAYAAELMIEKGAKIDAQQNDGLTPLHFTAFKNRPLRSRSS